jgi:uncharacterized phage protein (TIGR02220 family)
MSKDPAFLFYPNDWIGGTMGMPFEEKGAYMELLILQFNRGHMTSHMIGQQVGQLWVKIQDKFKIDTNGLYYNERLEIEINRRKAYVQSRSNNISGKNQYSKKTAHMNGHMTSHMENENRNEDIDVIIDYLNIRTGKNFKSQTEKIKKQIKARLKEGFTVENFKKVIDNRCEKWLKDEKMNEYLRPETLFGTKFESYLNVVTGHKTTHVF